MWHRGSIGVRRFPMRIDGYAPIRDYAAIGDGRTVALVAGDGSIDWLCLPDADSRPVFARILDPTRGGSFRLEPVEAFEVERRYRKGSNVLETTFRTASGAVRVTDALVLADRTICSPMRELVRRVEGLAGRVRMRWSIEPSFDFGRSAARIERRYDRVVIQAGRSAVAISSWGGGEHRIEQDRIDADFLVEQSQSVVLSLTSAHGEPLVLVTRDHAEKALERTDAFWRDWSARARYDGPWRDAVVRSALVLKLLVYSPSGASVAAPTTSLPERLGGERNWDYRYTWLRDATWTLDSLLSLGYHDEATAFFWWLMHATRLTQPRLHVLYGLDGGVHLKEHEVDGVPGYRGSRPVRTGNGAARQVQLDVYGSVLDGIWRYAKEVGRIDGDTGKEIAEIADYVAQAWRDPDSGIWEGRDHPSHYTQSKAMCWLALDRAAHLAEDGIIPDRADTWRRAADEVRGFYQDHGWDDELGSYVRAPDRREVDASLLTLALLDCVDPRGERMLKTIDTIRRDLGVGPFLYRYLGEDGLPPGEGAFLPCAFWLAAALARAGRRDEALGLMEDLIAAANDVGLYSEEIDPDTREFLGNFPQGLTHLALVNAAVAIEESGE
jgi:GH15 family glucan-1,4-alpha-glucosidase